MTQEIPFRAYIIADAAGSALETDEAEDASASRFLTMPGWIKAGKITKVAYRLNPTNAVTYQLIILEGSAAANYAQAAKQIYRSAALLADDTPYLDTAERAFILDTAGAMYYIIDWSGAPGNTLGYIMVEGVAYV